MSFPNIISSAKGSFIFFCISLSNSAKDYLIEEGYDRKFGARPLERLIQKKIKEPLADEIIFGKLKKGGKVIVEFNKEQLKIKLTK